jgi:hypothetical protein
MWIALVCVFLLIGAAATLTRPDAATTTMPNEASTTTPRSTTTPSRCAVHEAGHTVADWYCTSVARVLEVSTIDPELAEVDGDGGAALGHTVCVRRSGDAAAKWCEVSCLLAGLAAELLVFKRARSRWGAWGDIASAREIARKLVDTAPPWPTTREHVPDLARCLARALPGEVAVLTVAYAESRRVVGARHAQLLAVARALDNAPAVDGRRTLSEDDLEALLGSRCFVTALAMLPGKFVVR